jgi:hypothetical protein
VTREENLSLAEGPAAEVGATAAALLLARHRQLFAEFGVQPSGDATLTAIGLTGYRFATPAGRRRVLQWCAETDLDTGAVKQVASQPARAATGL